MTTMAFGMGVRQGRSLRIGAAGGVVAGLGVLLVLAVLASGSRSSAPSGAALVALADRQAAVTSWEAAVKPLIDSGGQVVALGPRKAIGQLQQGAVTDAAMRNMAAGWVRRLSSLQQEIAAVPTPDSLRRAHALLSVAMSGYVIAARDLLAAASAAGASRAQMLTAAATAGTDADKTYDQATKAIAEIRAQLSLPTDWSTS